MQDEYASKMEMVKYHTAETADLREEFRKEIERKLAEQKKYIKVSSQHTHSHC